MNRKWPVLVLFFLWISLALSAVQAADADQQNGSQAKNEFLPEARFFADMQKHFAHGPFQIVYSWEANIGFKPVVYRRGPHAFLFEFDVQTAGAPPTGQKINIAGTSYTLGGAYLYKVNQNTLLSLGVTHLSSHLSEDVLKIIERERRQGVIIPQVRFDDINVGFLEIEHHFAFKNLEPAIRFRVQPLGIKFRGGYNIYDEPIFIATQLKVWRHRSHDLLFITRHEFGERSLNDGLLRFDFLKPTPKEEGRFQVSFGYSPGWGLRASPSVGWHKQGFSTAMKFVFSAH